MLSSTTRLFAAAALALGLSGPAGAHDHAAMVAAQAAPATTAATITQGDLTIAGAFSRATLPNAPVGAAYLTITNTGASDDRLVSATSPVAGVVQLHEMTMENDVMKMAELPNGIPLPAGQTVTLDPGGLHIMLMDLKQPLVEGTAIPLTLMFEKAGTAVVDVPVGTFAADAPMDSMSEAAHGNGMNMSVGDLPDVDAISQMQKTMFDKPGSPLDMGPIVVAGEYAICDWSQGGMGGRALLRKTDKGWSIHLCSGDGLKDAANLSTIGVPVDVAAKLAADLAKAETAVDPDHLKLYGSFDGTMMIDPNLIKPAS